jgi:hypothetical protein
MVEQVSNNENRCKRAIVMSYSDALVTLSEATDAAAQAAPTAAEGERGLAAEAKQYFRLLDFITDRMRNAFGETAGYPEDSLVAYRLQEARHRLNAATYDVERFAYTIADAQQ